MDKAYRKLDASVRDSLAGFGRALTRFEENLMTIVDDIKAEVAKNREVTTSAVRLLELLTDRAQTAVDNRDLEALQDILTEVRADSDTLAAAVVANTPSAPVSPPIPAPQANDPVPASPPPVPSTPGDTPPGSDVE